MLMERKNSIDMNKKNILFIIIAIDSVFLIKSLYQLIMVTYHLSKTDFGMMNGLAQAMIQPRITDLKISIFFEILIICLCFAFMKFKLVKA